MGWLEELFVRPERRGGGVGATLLEAVLARAHGEGCAAVDLEVDEAHARAERLYERRGFRPLRRRRFALRLGGARRAAEPSGGNTSGGNP